MAKSAGYRWLCVFVVLTLLMGIAPRLAPVVQAAPVAQAAPAEPDLTALPQAAPPDPLARVQALLGLDPQTQAIDGVLGDLAGAASPADGRAGPYGPLSPPLEPPGVAPPALPEPPRPEIPLPAASTLAAFDAGAAALAQNAGDDGSEARPPATEGKGTAGKAQPVVAAPQRAGQSTAQAPPAEVVAMVAADTASAEAASAEAVADPASDNYETFLPLVSKSYADKAITPQGGTYTSPDGVVRLEFPAGAVAEPVTIDYQPEASARGARQSQPLMPGAFSIEARTAGGQAVSLARPVAVRITYPADAYGHTPLLRWWDGTRLRWVSVGSHSPAMATQATDGQAVLAASVTSLGTFALSDDDDEDPDEGEDGLLITRVCWEPELDLEYSIFDVELYTTTQEADPWAMMWVYWEEEDEEGEYDFDFYYWEERDFTQEPLVTVTLETVGPYTVGQVFSYTVHANDVISDEVRYDWHEGAFQAGTVGCVDGGSGCEPIPPVIEYVDIWQSGTGFSVVTVRATDNAGEPTVELNFNGQTVAMTAMGNGIFVAQVEYALGGSNSYQVTATDGCGNYTTFPGGAAITVPASSSGTFGWSSCKATPADGCLPPYQGRVGDPVNTANGNFSYRAVDAVVAGLGGTTMTLDRAYNSMAAGWTGASVMRYSDDGAGGALEEMVAGPPQTFGPGWTFPFGAYLLAVGAAPLYEGVQIQYADGHTVLFTANSDGTYTADSPRNHDTLTREGDEFVLRHKYTLEVERFDANGYLTVIEDRNGNAITLTYAGDRLVRVENASGRWLDFVYDTAGLITSVSMPEGIVLNYEYSDGLLTAFVDGRGGRTVYGYNENQQLVEILSPKGHASLRQVYDADDWRVVEQTEGAQERRTFAYSEDGSATTLTDAYGAQTIHTYDEQRRLVGIEYADGTAEHFDYDDDFNRTTHQDQASAEWHWTFDQRGNRLTEDGPLGWHRAWAYNDLDLVTSLQEKVDDDRTRETTYGYDDRGNLLQIHNPLGDGSTIQYDARGLPTDLWDFSGNHTHNAYDAEGDLVAVTNGEGETTGYDHDGLGRTVGMRTPLGYAYAYAYDANDNMVAVDGPLGYHLGYEFDANDNLAAEIDANSGRIEYTYDDSENLLEVRNQLGVTSAAYSYGLMNEMRSFQDGEGRQWGYDYDAMLRMTDIHGPLETNTHFAYDEAGNVTDITDAEGHVTHTEYDALYRAVAVTLNYKPGEPESADTNVTTGYEYDLQGNVLREEDPEGNATEYQYDLQDRMELQRSAEGQEWRYEYDGVGNVTSTTNPRGYVTGFEYDGAYRLLRTTDALGNVTQFEYDDDGNLTDEIDPLGVVTHYEYDELDRASREIRNYRPGEPQDAQTNVTTGYEYDLAGNMTTTTEPRGYQSQFDYDATHRLVHAVDYEGAHTTYTYDGVDNLLAVTDDNNHTMSYTFDALDRRTAVTNPESHSVTFAYDKVGNLLEMVDARGNRTQYDLDALGRTVRMVDALNGEWLTTYDRVGNGLETQDANGHVATYTYDRVYRLRTAVDAEGYVSESRWDENNNLQAFIDGNGHGTAYQYDELDRLWAVTNAEQETMGYRYDPLGNQTHLIEADGTVTRYGYDPLYRLAWVIQNTVDGGPEDHDTNVRTGYRYDASGNLDQITNANGATTAFEHDGMGRQVGEVDPLGNTWTYTYDGVGNRLSRLDANGALTAYEYYPDDQLKLVSYADGTSVGYGYDANNNRTSMVDALGQTTWAYDALNRVTEVVDAIGRGLQFGYDAVGNRVAMTYADGNVVAYGYYDNDWLETMVDPEGNVTAYQRDGVGNVTFIDNPNSTVTEIGYDQANRVLWLTNRQTVGGEETNSAFAYTYNEVGHVTQVASEYGWRNPPLVTESFFYDGLHRLAGMEDSDGTVMAYSYDRVGNRLVWETNDDLTTDTPLDGFATSYDYNAANQLLTATIDSETPNGDLTVAFGYDANGNRTGKLVSGRNGPEVGTDYGYDPENRLAVVQDYQLVDHVNRVDRALTVLAYDGDGRRLVKTYDPKAEEEEEDEGPKQVEYLFDGLDPVAEYEMLSGQRANYYRGAMGRITTWHHFPAGAPGQMFWYYYNFKGDVTGLTKHNGQSTHNYRYDPYGGVVPALGNFTDPHNHYTLTGKEWDEKTGLVYFGARHYDPGVGGWVTQDIYRGQSRSPASLHRYMYVHGNPSNYTDYYGFSLAEKWQDFNSWKDKKLEQMGVALIDTWDLLTKGETQTQRYYRESLDRELDLLTKQNAAYKRLVEAAERGECDVEALKEYYKYRRLSKLARESSGQWRLAVDADLKDYEQGLRAWGEVVRLIPIAGGMYSAVGAVTGRDPFSRQELSGLERGFEVVNVALNVVQIGSMVKSGATAAKAGTAGKTTVYQSINKKGVVQYVGIADDVEARAAQHLAHKKIGIEAIEGLENLSRADARAVEQVLIEHHGLDQLLNQINSISKANPQYEMAIQRGLELLKKAGYAGF